LFGRKRTLGVFSKVFVSCQWFCKDRPVLHGYKSIGSLEMKTTNKTQRRILYKLTIMAVCLIKLREKICYFIFFLYSIICSASFNCSFLFTIITKGSKRPTGLYRAKSFLILLSIFNSLIPLQFFSVK